MWMKTLGILEQIKNSGRDMKGKSGDTDKFQVSQNCKNFLG